MYEAIHRIYRMAGKEVQDVRPGTVLSDLSEAEAADLLKIGAVKRIEARVDAVAAAEVQPPQVADDEPAAAPEKKRGRPKKAEAAGPEADAEDFG